MVGPRRPPDLDPQLPKIRLPDQYVSFRNLWIKLPDLRIQAPDLSLQNPYISLRILSIGASSSIFFIKLPDLRIQPPDSSLQPPDLSLQIPYCTGTVESVLKEVY